MKTWLIVREKSVKIEDILHVCSFRHKVRPCSHKTFEQSQHCIYNIHKCSDWTILEYEFKIRTVKFYDGKARLSCV